MTKVALGIIGMMLVVSACGRGVGNSGSPGPQGPKGDTGNQGASGEAGIAGTNGANGLDGAPGTAVNFIQLCPGTPVYPSTFIEYGVCVNNQLYAVYSSNGGFLALLPPGAYSSNAIGSTCNFNVGANCAVSY